MSTKIAAKPAKDDFGYWLLMAEILEHMTGDYILVEIVNGKTQLFRRVSDMREIEA